MGQSGRVSWPLPLPEGGSGGGGTTVINNTNTTTLASVAFALGIGLGEVGQPRFLFVGAISGSVSSELLPAILPQSWGRARITIFSSLSDPDLAVTPNDLELVLYDQRDLLTPLESMLWAKADLEDATMVKTTTIDLGRVPLAMQITPTAAPKHDGVNFVVSVTPGV